MRQSVRNVAPAGDSREHTPLTDSLQPQRGVPVPIERIELTGVSEWAEGIALSDNGVPQTSRFQIDRC
jgi:hypothetical protein